MEKVLNRLKIDWENWTSGEKIISISFVVAIISMFLNWSYGGFFPQNGFTQLTVFFLLFWAYPLFMILTGKQISRNIGLGCSTGSLILTLFYIFSRNTEIFGSFINLAGIGAWVFMFSSLALGVGVYQSHMENQKESNSPSNQLTSELLPPK